jgi:hypothetical protein
LREIIVGHERAPVHERDCSAFIDQIAQKT